MTLPRIVILCSDRSHPVFAHLERWRAGLEGAAEVAIVARASEVGTGDFLFLIACQQIVGRDIRDRFRHSLVVHASDLPEGRGWSPLIWQILEGRNRIPASLIEAGEKVDEGRIWHQIVMAFEGTELAAEINEKAAEATIALMDWALAHCDAGRPREQTGTPTYYRKRTPADSEVDAEATIAESFDLLRIADENRYPAFVRIRGKSYRIRLDPLPDEGSTPVAD